MPEKIRTFIAIAVPEGARKVLGTVQDRLKPYDLGIRWVEPEKIHLTLSFLGDIAPDQVPPISETLRRVAESNTEEIALTVKGLGVFPGVKRPRVIWTGLSGSTAALSALQAQVASNLTDLGFERERRPFKAHLTLGRFKGYVNPGLLVEAMTRWGDFTPVDFRADKVVLFRSDLKPGGAVYTPLFQVNLKSRNRE